MNDLPFVSVIIPTFNAEKYIDQTLASVLSQSYQNYEVVIVDDGSTDGTLEVIRSCKDERFRVICQANSGAAAARNAGIRNSRGDLIAFIDSDDLWHPDKLARQVEFLNKNREYGLVYNAWEVISSDTLLSQVTFFGESNGGQLSIEDEHSGWLYEVLLTDSCVVHTSAAMLRKDVIERVGFFDTNLLRGQDYDYWLRVSRDVRIAKLAACLSCYRTNPEGVTIRGAPENYAAQVLNKSISAYGATNVDGSIIKKKKIRKRLSGVWRNFAQQHCSLGSFNIAFPAAARALKYSPLDYMNWKTLAVVIFDGIRGVGIKKVDD